MRQNSTQHSSGNTQTQPSPRSTGTHKERSKSRNPTGLYSVPDHHTPSSRALLSSAWELGRAGRSLFLLMTLLLANQ